jgi:hypothetical protein
MGKRSADSQDDSEDSVESWIDKDTRVLVTQPEGFMCQVSLALVPQARPGAGLRTRCAVR